MRRTPRLPGLLGIGIALTAAACGGDDDGGSDASYSEGEFEESTTLEALCESPRSGSDLNGNDYPDEQGSEEDEKLWLRSWTHELYLWYREVPDEDPADYETLEYFDLLKTSATTPSGRPKDQFHFIYETDEWEALSQTGVSAGYGATFTILVGSPPRQVVVAYNEPGSAAAKAGLDRGDEILTVDGVSVIDGSDVGTLNDGLFPSEAGTTHTIEILDLGAKEPRTIELTAEEVASAPVQNVTTLDVEGGPVGYMLFNDHIATAEPALRDAIDELAKAGITDLILDLRYNGGGYLAIASELAYQIAGPDATADRAFEELAFNDQYPGIHPLTGSPIQPTPFFDTTVPGISSPSGGEPLSSLGLSRVFVLTGPNTCSASESIMNGLRGIDVEVIQIGTTTCGKPYGFYPWDNCGITYFSIQFQGVNDKGFGDYADGFTPNGEGEAGLPGCEVPDDFTHALGDPEEARLAAALFYRTEGACPEAAEKRAKPGLSAIDGRVVKPVWRENRIVPRPDRR